MSGRLARGRELLRERLASRDQALPADPLVALLPPAAVAPGLIRATVQAAVPFATGRVTGPGALSASVAALAEEVLRALSGPRWRWLTLFALALLLAGAVACLFGFDSF
jgi:hypothetical protein